MTALKGWQRHSFVCPFNLDERKSLRKQIRQERKENRKSKVLKGRRALKRKGSQRATKGSREKDKRRRRAKATKGDRRRRRRRRRSRRGKLGRNSGGLRNAAATRQSRQTTGCYDLYCIGNMTEALKTMRDQVSNIRKQTVRVNSILAKKGKRCRCRQKQQCYTLISWHSHLRV